MKESGRAKKQRSLEEVLLEQLRKEMFLESGKKFRVLDEWDTVMQSVYEVPIEYDGYTKKANDMWILKEIVDILDKGKFQDVKRSESRRKQMKELARASHMYYNMIFTIKDSIVGYGVLIHFPELRQDNPQRSSGIVLAAKHVIKGDKEEVTYEKARFDDFLLEARPYIELIGDLYRKSRKP